MSLIKSHLEQYLDLDFHCNTKRYFEYLLKHGTLYELDQFASIEDHAKYKVLNKIGFRQCYSNSVRVAKKTDLLYYEGYYLFSNFPITTNHAFNVDKKSDLVYDFTALKYLEFRNILEWFGVCIPVEEIKALKYRINGVRTPLELNFEKLLKNEFNETNKVTGKTY